LNKHGIKKTSGETFQTYRYEEEAWRFIEREKDKNKEFLEDPQIFKSRPHVRYGVVHLNEWDSTITDGDESKEKGAEKIWKWCQADLKPLIGTPVADYWDNTRKRYHAKPWPNEGFLIVYMGEKIWIPDEKSKKDINIIRREITSKELHYGIETKSNTEYELICPAFRFQLRFNFEEVKKDKYILYSSDLDTYYKKTLIVENDVVRNGDKLFLYFQGIDKNVRYTLDVEPGPDENGNKPNKITIFKDKTYNEYIE